MGRFEAGFSRVKEDKVIVSLRITFESGIVRDLSYFIRFN